LLTELVQESGLPPAVRATILEKAGGNPFYLEEVVRALVDAGHIVKEGGRWRATGGLTEVSLPGTLAGVIGARIDGLPEAERQVAQTASVIGREFAARLLRAVMEEPTGAPPDLDARLGSLTVEGLL